MHETEQYINKMMKLNKLGYINYKGHLYVPLQLYYSKDPKIEQETHINRRYFEHHILSCYQNKKELPKEVRDFLKNNH
jgi:hypothetical protein